MRILYKGCREAFSLAQPTDELIEIFIFNNKTDIKSVLLLKTKLNVFHFHETTLFRLIYSLITLDFLYKIIRSEFFSKTTTYIK